MVSDVLSPTLTTERLAALETRLMASVRAEIDLRFAQAEVRRQEERLARTRRWALGIAIALPVATWASVAALVALR
jgi:hypothetical protein